MSELLGVSLEQISEFFNTFDSQSSSSVGLKFEDEEDEEDRAMEIDEEKHEREKYEREKYERVDNESFDNGRFEISEKLSQLNTFLWPQ